MSFLRRVCFSQTTSSAQIFSTQAARTKFFLFGLSLVAPVFLSLLSPGCASHSGGVVEETEEYSYDDIMAQAAEEELASEAERER